MMKDNSFFPCDDNTKNEILYFLNLHNIFHIIVGLLYPILKTYVLLNTSEEEWKKHYINNMFMRDYKWFRKEVFYYWIIFILLQLIRMTKINVPYFGIIMN